MRKKLILLVGAAGIIIAGALFAKQKFFDYKYRVVTASQQASELAKENEIKDGDIIFQTDLSEQSLAVQLATHSPYSHCGIIYRQGDTYIVFEAVQPVKKTPLDKWIARGKNGHFVIKRLKNAQQLLTAETLSRMKDIGESFMGRNYDGYFNWSDERIYCSELVWKTYQRAAGIEVGKLEKLGDFDLSNKIVKKELKERYGDHIPFNEPVISPADIFNSDLLVTVMTD